MPCASEKLPELLCAADASAKPTRIVETYKQTSDRRTATRFFAATGNWVSFKLTALAHRSVSS